LVAVAVVAEVVLEHQMAVALEVLVQAQLQLLELQTLVAVVVVDLIVLAVHQQVVMAGLALLFWLILIGLLH
jgi:hypothetical protein